MASSGALTLHIRSRAGRFELRNDRGHIAATGVARPSVTRKGYVTLTFTKLSEPLTGQPIRVPADWLTALEEVEVEDGPH